MKIIIHHHALIFQSNGRLFLPSFIGAWIDAIASKVDKVGLLLSTSDEHYSNLDYELQAENIEFHILGHTVAKRMQSKKKEMEQNIQSASKGYDHLLIRGMTPRQLMVYKNSKAKSSSFLLVGSLIDSKPNLTFNFISLFIWLRHYQKHFQLKRISKEAQVFANSPLIVSELNSVLGIQASFVPTNTLSNSQFSEFKPLKRKGPYTMVFCGRIVQDKGVEELIEALELLRLKGFDVNLKVLGRASEAYQKHLDGIISLKQLDELIRFEGFVKFGPDLMDHYKQSDLFVLPTWHEGFPHSIWEAAACSLPIFVTSVGGIPGVLNEDLVTFCAVRDYHDIAEQVMKALTNLADTNLKTQKMLEFSKGFSVEECASKLLANIFCE